MNPAEDEEPPLPPIADSVLDGEQLTALFADLEQLVELDGVQLKRGPGHVRDDAGASLPEALELLRSGAVRGVQIRYRHAGAHWLDTLMSTPAGVRLVRIRHDL
jgi:hypothetical protein